MEAVDFIKKHGVDKARKVVEGAPDGVTHYFNSDYGLIALKDLKQAIADYESIYCVADIEKCEFELGLAPDEQYVKSGGEHV